MLRKIRTFIRNQSGVTAIEYAVIAAAIIVAVASVVGSVGTNANTTFTAVKNAL